MASSSELVLNRYRPGARLAVGGMGELFIAESPEGKRVVLKALLPQLAKDPQMVAQFLDEARLASRLKHPNLVAVHEFGQWNDTWVLAMEFVDGLDLAQVLKRASRSGLAVPWQVACAVIAEAANGLQFAHELNDANGARLELIHRDVSPQNILVGRDGRTRVLDFGIADSADKSTRTATGIVKGKLAYMAPEQARSEPMTASVDQFALGLVLWELLTGKRAYSSPTDVSLLKEVIAGQVQSPSSVSANVPAAVETIVMRMLKANAADRYASCRDVHLALRSQISGDPQAAVSAFIAKLPEELAHESAKNTPSARELNTTPAIASVTPRKTPTPANTPLLNAYLASLPQGLESFPHVQQKGSIVQSFLDGVPIYQHLKLLPPAVVELVKHPPLPSAWISEVKAAALYLACADLCFPSADAWLEFAYRANKKIIEGPLYSVLFRVLGVKRIVSVVAGRWEQFHRGTSLTVVRFEGQEGLLRLESPAGATPMLLAQAHGSAVRATVEIVGMKNVTVTCTQSAPNVFDYVCRWTD